MKVQTAETQFCSHHILIRPVLSFKSGGGGGVCSQSGTHPVLSTVVGSTTEPLTEDDCVCGGACVQ